MERLLLDENIGLWVYQELKRRGYHVQSVIEEARGASDEEIVRIAKKEEKVIVTQDKDFGLLAITLTPPGVVLIRGARGRREILRRILSVLESGLKLYGYLTVVGAGRVRRRRL